MSKAIELAKQNQGLSLPDFLELLERENLSAVEVSSADVTQSIKIDFNPVTGQIKWQSDNTDGAYIQHIMITAMYDMFRYFIKIKERPKFDAGSAQVLIKLEPDRLMLAFDETDDPYRIKTVLMLALWEIIERTSYEPVEDLKKLIEIPQS